VTERTTQTNGVTMNRGAKSNRQIQVMCGAERYLNASRIHQRIEFLAALRSQALACDDLTMMTRMTFVRDLRGLFVCLLGKSEE
jgi:hypothetical protein